MIHKILPGVYIDTVAGKRVKTATVSGVVTIPLELDWGDRVITLEKGESPMAKTGYRMTDPKIKLINEVMNHADKLIVYRLSEGIKAKATMNTNVTAEALYGGIRGNDITLTVKPVGDGFVVKTFVALTEVDSQTVKTALDFVSNSFVGISGSGTLAEKTIKLAGGTNGTTVADAYDRYFEEIEKHEYNIMAYTGPDAAIQEKVKQFVERMRRENGVMIQAVMSGAGFDSAGIINSTIGGKTETYSLSAHEACATTAGIMAKCGAEKSATYFEVTGWMDVVPRLSVLQSEVRTNSGETLYTVKYGKIILLYDQNSLVTYTEQFPKDFSKNLIVRTLGRYANDLEYLLNTQVIGKVRNNTEGRNRIKGFISDMTVSGYLNRGYIEGFTADDIAVSPGGDRDSIVATVGIKPVDTVDKIYITVTAL